MRFNMSYANIPGVKIVNKYINGKKRWFVEYEGVVVSEPLKTRNEAINCVLPLIVTKNRYINN